MVLQLIQGWDDGIGLLSDEWDYPTRQAQAGGPRFPFPGANSLALGTSYYDRNFHVPDPQVEMVIGSAVKFQEDSHPGNYQYGFLQLGTTLDPVYGTQGIEVYCGNTNTNELYIRLNQGSNTYPTGFVPPLGSWMYIELKGTFHPSAGSVELRINGVTILVLTGVRTQSGDAPDLLIDRGRFNWAGGGTTSFDDSYMLDTTGSENNDFLGDVRVAALRPTGPGDSTQWDGGNNEYVNPDPDMPNWDRVNDATGTYANYFVETATAGDVDLYTLPDLVGANIEIFGVQVSSVSWKTDSGDTDLSMLTKADGVTYEDALTLDATPRIRTGEIQTTTPAGNPWTKEIVAAMQVGVKAT